MTEVLFHHGATDPVDYACRLLFKAYGKRARVAVTGPAETLAALDLRLWTFEPLAFVPHVRLLRGSSPTQRMVTTPIWLVDLAGDAPQATVLVNFGPDIALGFESYERLSEIVGSEDSDVLSGRARWRHLKARGYAMASHQVR